MFGKKPYLLNYLEQMSNLWFYYEKNYTNQFIAENMTSYAFVKMSIGNCVHKILYISPYVPLLQLLSKQ